MDRPPFRAGKGAVDGFDIHSLPRLGAQRTRAATGNGFLHGRRFRTCTDGPGVGRPRDNLVLGVNHGAGPPGGQPGLTKNGADLIGQQPDGQHVAKLTLANHRHTQRHQPLADRGLVRTQSAKRQAFLCGGRR